MRGIVTKRSIREQREETSGRATLIGEKEGRVVARTGVHRPVNTFIARRQRFGEDSQILLLLLGLSRINIYDGVSQIKNMR